MIILTLTREYLGSIVGQHHSKTKFIGVPVIHQNNLILGQSTICSAQPLKIQTHRNIFILIAGIIVLCTLTK